MENTVHRAIAIVGVGAVLPDAPNATAFWENIKSGRYSITEVSPDRWDPKLYYDADPAAPDKTYSKIGGWVREFVWDPIKWHLPIPPRVAAAMDGAQQWAIKCTREALQDYGYPNRPLNLDRTAVILGNAMAGEKHYLTALRVYFPEYAKELEASASFAALPESVRVEITRELRDRMGKHLPEVTEDSMPGELANCIAGRIANVFNFHGPNYVVDAACASAMAAISSAIEGLIENDFDAVITGGIDRNMGAPTFVKFCKIGALSATGTRPYAEGADGFVMGEGAAIFVLKRLADAERDGDKIYAVIRGMGGSSDGKGKGITAPNPVGQKFAIERAWQNAGLSPATVTYIEGHGTSTKVGDVVEVQSMMDALSGFNLPAHSVAIGSVKSNIGHLKGAAGAAGLLKAAFALHDKVLPPSVNYKRPNPDIDFTHSPLFVNTELKPWTVPADVPRRAGLSAFGFGGTNFHAVLEEYIPHRLNGNGKRSTAVSDIPKAVTSEAIMNASELSRTSSYKAPLRGALVIGAESAVALAERLRKVQEEAKAGRAPAPAVPAEADLRAAERITIDYADAAELATKSGSAMKALNANQPAIWKALRAQGIFRGHGPAPKVAFLYTGQGSQYVNMLKPLRAVEPIVAETFAEADRVMTPMLGKPLTDFIYVDAANADAVAKAEKDLMQTEITQPAVLATDISMTRMLAAYGITPDFTMGHSLGEYGALIASGAMPFDEAMEAVSARGRGMARVAVADKGLMAAVFAPLAEIERILKTIDGYVVIANINSEHQAVIGGASAAVTQAIAAFQNAGFEVAQLPVSHAFHTSIVAPASEPLRDVLKRLHLKSPGIPVVANINGEFYPMGPDVVPEMVDILAKQVAAPVQFVKGLHTLYAAGARAFVEVGPKKALQGFAEDVLGSHAEVVSLFTNHPKQGDIVAFNQALCGLYAAGLGRGISSQAAVEVSTSKPAVTETDAARKVEAIGDRVTVAAQAFPAANIHAATSNGDRLKELGKMFADVLERGWEIYGGDRPAPVHDSVVITGAALGLPGTEHIFDDDNVGRILRGEQFIDVIPTRFRQAILDKNITRLVKSDNGGPTFESINQLADVIKLAARGKTFDLEKEYGVSADRIAALDRVTCLAIAAGIDALRDAGIPLVMRYKTTTKGTQLPDRWMLPEAMRDDTGVIFGSAFPGYDAFADEMARYYEDRARRQQLAGLESLRARVSENNGSSMLLQEINRRIEDIRLEIEKHPYMFDRRFLFRTLSMGHSQFAEFIGARGPNTAVNTACATTTHAVTLAEDWIRAGRCRRVIVISADDVTSDHMLEWIGAGFLASGAAATDEVVEDAAIPFDKRRHGLIIGMGAAALVVESNHAARERGIQPICEVMSAVTANSAFHGSRLDVQHIGDVMEKLVAQAESHAGVSRKQIAPQMVFVSHETYTPARGGSASAEIYALRKVFGDDANKIVITNTKGFTGHAMGTGIEEVVAVKALETACVPPVANFKEVDPELGSLNLSKGGIYPVEYALHLAAGFGSQISMTLMRWTKTKDGAHRTANGLGYGYRIADPDAWQSWLSAMSGQPVAELEVVQRTLRVKNGGAPARSVEPIQQAAKAETVSEAKAASAVPVRSPGTMQAAAMANAETTITAVKASATAVGTKPTSSHSATVVPATVTPGAQANAIPSSSAKIVTEARQESAPAIVGDSVKDQVLVLVSEKTGYPVDMLDLDLDLEADLGVDTVKQAEVFATIREAYGIVRDDKIKLRDFPTLAHVIRFVYDRRPDLLQKPATPEPKPVAAHAEMADAAVSVVTPATVAAAASRHAEDVKDRVLALVAEKTGYPMEMLDLDLDLEADLGVDTVKQAEVFATIREAYGIQRDDKIKLRDFPTLAHVIQFVYERRPDLAPHTTAEIKQDQQLESVAQSVPDVKLVVAPEMALSAAPGKAARINANDEVKERILTLMVEKTGYPREMLDLDLDLEADLGVDTVKQAEMFAAIREIYNIPRDENRKLRDYPTLAHVIRFVLEKRPDLAGAGSAAATTVAIENPATSSAKASPTVSSEAPPNATTPPAAAGSTGVIVTDEMIREKVLEIVAEKTGYPKEMLDLDLDLEADLGIDTVKQAEMFAAVRGAYNIPRDETLKLRDFPTLAHVIQFARERQRMTVAGVPNVAVAKSNADVAAKIQQPMKKMELASFDAANQIPRRVPVPVLRPPLEVCKSTGVTLGAGKRVVVMGDCGGIAEILVQQLRSRKVEVLSLPRESSFEDMENTLRSWTAAGPIHGVYWLPALDFEGRISEMNVNAWREALRVRIKSLFVTMRTLFTQIAEPGTFLISATRMGGQHGYDEAGALAPLGGAVAGFTKTYKRERIDATVKAIDFEADRAAADIAKTLVEEALRDPGAVEIGYKQGLRWSVSLREEPAADGGPGITLNKETVFLVTGAAGSIVSAITADLAAASGGTFYLLDLVPEPKPNDPDLARFMTDRDGLKRDLFARIQERGERATPALVEKELAGLERAQAAQSAIDAVRAAGGTAHYFSVNLTDGDAVCKVIDEVRRRSGRIDVLLHAAGMERSHMLPDKDPKEFNLIFDVKADGFFHLLHAIGDMPLKATVAFSSIAGRFGNAGQTDYSSANDLLCKITSSFRSERLGTRGIVIDWTAWGGLGMATRGSIPKMMELAGIDMLPPEAGIPLIRRELTAGSTRGEVVVGQRLGILLNEWDPTGGLDVEAFSKMGTSLSGPMLGRVVGASVYSGVEIETALNPAEQPFLHDHQIDGTAVLPGVMGIEAFAEAASALVPGWRVEAIENVNFLAPYKFYRGEPRTVSVRAVLRAEKETVVADCQLIGKRQLPNQSEPQITVHFTGRVILTKHRAELAAVEGPSEPHATTLGSKEIYRLYFHGPAYQVIERAWWDGKHMVGQFARALPPNHAGEMPLSFQPRWIELAFQTAGIWEMAVQHRMGLPLHIDRVVVDRIVPPDNGVLYAVVTPSVRGESFDVNVVGRSGARYAHLTGYKTVALPNALDESSAKLLHEIMQPEVAMV